MEVEHGAEIYPVSVSPGGITLDSEDAFVEFVRQEMASRDVRDAIRVVASYAREPSLSEW